MSIPNLDLSFTDILVGTDSSSAAAQAAKGVKAVAQMALKLTSVFSFGKESTNKVNNSSQNLSTALAGAQKKSAIGDSFVSTARGKLKENGGLTSAKVNANAAQIKNNTGGNSQPQQTVSNSGGTPSATGNNSTPGTGATQAATKAPENNNSAKQPAINNQGNSPDNNGNANNTGAGAYFDRKLEAMDKEAESDKIKKAENGDKNAQNQIQNAPTDKKPEIGDKVKSDDKSDKVQKKDKIDNNPQANKAEKEKADKKKNINNQIKKLTKENKETDEKKKQFKPKVEADDRKFANQEKSVDTLTQKLKQNQKASQTQMATAQKQLDKSEEKADKQKALTGVTTGLGIGAEAANLLGSALMSTPVSYGAGIASAIAAFGLNTSAQITDQQATKYGKEASEIYDTASKDMQNASAKYSASSKMLANKKESISNKMMAQNVARNQEILSATRGDKSKTNSNNSQIQNLQKQQKMINYEMQSGNNNSQRIFLA